MNSEPEDSDLVVVYRYRHRIVSSSIHWWLTVGQMPEDRAKCIHGISLMKSCHTCDINTVGE